MKIETYHSDEEKHRWKLVRTDTYTDIPGEILTADDATGECSVTVNEAGESKTKTYNLGLEGLKIVARGR